MRRNVRPAMRLKVAFSSMEALAQALNELDGHPVPVARPTSPRIGAVAPYPTGLLKPSTDPPLNPWLLVLQAFTVLSPSVRTEEAQRQRDTALPAHMFMGVRALRFGERTIIPERPSTATRAADAAIWWLADVFSASLRAIVKRCEACTRWWADRSKGRVGRRCPACRPRWWTRARRRAANHAQYSAAVKMRRRVAAGKGREHRL
jgi:hypothetical protein